MDLYTGRHEVTGHGLGDRSPYVERRDLRGSSLGERDMGDELQRTGRPERADGGTGDLGQGEQCGLDLAGFDPVAADLHLVVGPAEEQGAASRHPPHEVTGAVGAGAVRVREDVTEDLTGGPTENSGGLLRASAVAQCDLRTGEDELTDLVVRHRLTVGVQDQRGHARYGATDGDRSRRNACGEGVHRGLGGPVDIPRRDPGRREPVPQGRRDRLTAEDDGAHHGVIERAGVDERTGERGGGIEDADPVALQHGAHRGRITDGAVVVEVHGRSGEDPGELVEGGVEGEGRRVRDMETSVGGA